MWCCIAASPKKECEHVQTPCCSTGTLTPKSLVCTDLNILKNLNDVSAFTVSNASNDINSYLEKYDFDIDVAYQFVLNKPKYFQIFQISDLACDNLHIVLNEMRLDIVRHQKTDDETLWKCLNLMAYLGCKMSITELSRQFYMSILEKRTATTTGLVSSTEIMNMLEGIQVSVNLIRYLQSSW